MTSMGLHVSGNYQRMSSFLHIEVDIWLSASGNPLGLCGVLR